MTKMIPDISHYHPVSDWVLVKDNVEMLISKATQGTAYIDPTLDDFIDGCEANKIPYWLYSFLNKGGELAQAKFLVNVCKNRVGDFFRGYVLDAEMNNSAANLRVAMDWLKTQEKQTMLYIGWSDLGMYKDLIEDRGTTVWWEARYGNDTGVYSPKYPPHTGVNLHQYTSNGECPGIPGKIDLNRPVDFAETGPAPEPEGKAYDGTWPVFPDGRECYREGDGIIRLREYPTQIKRTQKLIAWISGRKLTIDGKFGPKTAEACREAQKIVGARVDGIFGPQTLRMAKSFRK
jgi:GH25 family lysozyme M1 (1,4-beta-N-acetylmuramidase)